MIEMMEIVAVLGAEAETEAVVEAADSLGGQVYAMLKAHGMVMPSVRASIALGMLVARQILADTMEFGVRSMEGDPTDEEMIKRAMSAYWYILVSDVDHLEQR